MGDFNSDGKLDLAVSGYASGPGFLGILFGNGDGTFQTPLLFTAYAPTGAPVVVTDLNGDGIDDALVAAEGGSLFLSAPMATVSPSLLAFGTVATGATSGSMAITVTNSGNSPLHVTGAGIAAPFSIAGPVCPSALVRLANCEIPVVFAPSTPGQQSGQVAIQEDAVNSKPLVLVTGTAVTPSLTSTPESLTFSGESIGTTSAAQTVTLSNTSSVAVTISSVTASGPFAVTSQCGPSLAAAATCSIAVTFTPTTVGQQTGSLTISDDAAGSPQNIALSGSGVAALSVAPQAGQSTSSTVESRCRGYLRADVDCGPRLQRNELTELQRSAGKRDLHCHSIESGPLHRRQRKLLSDGDYLSAGRDEPGPQLASSACRHRTAVRRFRRCPSSQTVSPAVRDS